MTSDPLHPQAPAVTAMMLVRDRADLLPAAAGSVLSQTLRDLELIILDDGSVDDTWHVCEQLAARDTRVRLLRNTTSAGIPAARNQVLDADPQLAGVGARISAFAEDDPTHGDEPDWHWGLADGRLPFAFPTALLRTDAVRAVGGFDTSYAIAEDLQLAYRLAGSGGHFDSVDEVLVDYRIHAGSITARRARTREWCTLRAQLVGVRELRGRLSPRGYAVIVQSALRLVLAAVGLRR